jgi:flavin reductase (DIM6/NTAB) family NADH-FMN oxidoreductase RutF
MIVKTSELNQAQAYKLLIGSVLPRPIAWVSTVSKQGQPNLAPFSFFTVASSYPPVLCFSPALKEVEVDGKLVAVPKDTLRNVEETGEFVVNMVSLPLAEKMNLSSAEFAFGVSEFEKTGLTAVAAEMVRAPRLGEALISMECRLNQIVRFGTHPGAGNLVLGDVVCFHVADSIYNEAGHIDIQGLQPVGRLSGTAYCRVEDLFQMARPRAE